MEERPFLIDATGPRHRVETWMALVLTLACPLVYWTMLQHPGQAPISLVLLVTIVLVATAMAFIEQKRATEEPRRYRRGLATILTVLGCLHLAVLSIGLVVSPTGVIVRYGNTDGGTIHSLPDQPFNPLGCTPRLLSE